jgi:hypothetical protein
VETCSGTKAGRSDSAAAVSAAASAVLPVIDVAALQDVEHKRAKYQKKLAQTEKSSLEFQAKYKDKFNYYDERLQCLQQAIACKQV